MSIKTPVICACVLAAAATPTALLAGSPHYGYASDSGAESVADRTIARREEDSAAREPPSSPATPR